MPEAFAINLPFRELGGMILAAGLGSRLKPWTDTHPKALALINGKSLLQRNIEYLQYHKIRKVVVNVHRFAEQIIEVVERNDGWGSTVIFSDEREQLLETGGGFLKAAPLLKDFTTIVLMNVDILTDLNLHSIINYHQDKSPLATLATTDRKTSRYFLFDEGNNLCGWKNINTGEEKPEHKLFSLSKREKEILQNECKIQSAFSGIHVVDPQIFSLIKQQGKFSMVDVYLDLMQDHTIKSFDHSDSKFVDVGKPENILKAEIMFA